MYLARTPSAVGQPQRSETEISRHGTESRASIEGAPSLSNGHGLAYLPLLASARADVYLLRTPSTLAQPQRSETGSSRHGRESPASIEGGAFAVKTITLLAMQLPSPCSRRTLSGVYLVRTRSAVA